MDIVVELRNAVNSLQAKSEERFRRIEKNLGTAEADGQIKNLNEVITSLSDKLEKQRNDAETRMEHLELQLALGAGNRPLGDGPDAEKALVETGRQIAALYQNRMPENVQAPSAEETRKYLADLETYFRRGIFTNEMTIGGDPQGGYWVTPDMSGRIVELIYETSPMRQICSVQEIMTDRLTGPNSLFEAEFKWVGETEAPGETNTPDIGEWEIPVHEAAAEPHVSQNLLDDSSVDIENWLSEQIADRIARGENEAFISGNGQKKPRGLLDYPIATTETTAATWGTFQGRNSGHDSAALTNADVLILLTGDLKTPYMPNARWGMNRRTLATVRTIKDSEGHYVFVPDFSMSPYGVILGHPVSPLEDMPDWGAQNRRPIAFGDFMKTYQIVQRQGIRVLRDNLTRKPFVKYYTTCRVGGAVLNFEAMKFVIQD